MKRVGLLRCLFAALCGFTLHSHAAPLDVSDVGWHQRPGARLPLQLEFHDETGRTAALRDYFGASPVVLVFTYFSCPRLCPEVLRGVQESLRATGLKAGSDYALVAVSIDPRDTPARAVEQIEHVFGDSPVRQGAHLLTASSDSASRLAKAAGFTYLYDERHDQFAHAAGMLIANPDGAISRYFFGVRYPGDDVRAALIDAGRGRIAALTDRLLLLCYHFDPETGRYSLAIMQMLRVFGVASVLLAAFAWWRVAHKARGGRGS